MLKNLRLEKILSLLESKEYVSIHELMEITSSSESTIRADLVLLEKENKLIRLHGGAQSLKKPSSLNELDMNEKYLINVEEKTRIGKKAASFIQDNSLIYIDAGTTTSYLCDYISTNGNIIITNSMTIAQKLTKQKYKVYVTNIPDGVKIYKDENYLYELSNEFEGIINYKETMKEKIVFFIENWLIRRFFFMLYTPMPLPSFENKRW